jgi:hypothetical protein
MTLAARVLEEWRRAGVARDDDVAGARDALLALERLRDVVLPDAFRALWSLSDGTGSLDDHSFMFWPLDNVTSDPSLGPWQGRLVFAEWQQGSRYFCLRFEGRTGGAVVTEKDEIVAESFDAFLERYLTAPESLLPHRRAARLAFSNRRQIDGADYASTAPWLAGVPLSPDDRQQLFRVVRLFGSNLTDEEILAGDARFFAKRAQALAESPVEWWDIGDAAPRFQLWLCNADSGYLFDAGTTEMRANVIQWSFDIDHALPDDVRRAIGEAAARAVADAQDSLLAEIDFGGSSPTITVT